MFTYPSAYGKTQPSQAQRMNLFHNHLLRLLRFHPYRTGALCRSSPLPPFLRYVHCRSCCAEAEDRQNDTTASSAHLTMAPSPAPPWWSTGLAKIGGANTREASIFCREAIYITDLGRDLNRWQQSSVLFGMALSS